MKIRLNTDYYDYGCCNSCKNGKINSHGWIWWCTKKKQGVNTYNRCNLYRLRRKLVRYIIKK